MKEFIGKFLITLGKVPGFKNIVIGFLIKNSKMMDYIDAATEIYKSVKKVSEDADKGSESSK